MNWTEELAKAKTVGISGHVRPDGDCVGSCLAVANYIRENYKEIQVDVYLEEFGEKLAILPGADTVLHTEEKEICYDLYVALDTSTKERLGVGANYFDTAKRTICIDHHVSNEGYGDVFLLNANASSCAEFLYHLLEKEKVSLNTATCIYTGMVHDTGAFRYSNVSPMTLRAAADLLEKGVDAALITDRFIETTLEQKKLNGLAFEKAESFFDGKMLFTYLTLEDFAACGISTKGQNGVVGALRDTQGVDCAAFLMQADEETLKLSMRSKKIVDVNQICGIIGGGGHVRAAGATVKGKNPLDIRDIIVSGVAVQFEESAK